MAKPTIRQSTWYDRWPGNSESPLTEISWRQLSPSVWSDSPEATPFRSWLVVLSQTDDEELWTTRGDNDRRRRPLMNEWCTLGLSSAGFPVINWICCARVIRTSTHRDIPMRATWHAHSEKVLWLVGRRERWHGSRYQDDLYIIQSCHGLCEILCESEADWGFSKCKLIKFLESIQFFLLN